ncbi:hypothetical protein PsorP6_002791 [Peronosclerospora sorghi]|uniref:Uncharacterized protein n=1 Tax=Peronosclerospora sorghi TaxID=230839 RepID=A0ACC0VIS6_9STRA|nr:hypothetical protein PsorP6_002791 [Peronosclerospora sorghi]
MESIGIDDDYESAAGSIDSFSKSRSESRSSSARRFGNGDKKKIQKQRSKRLNRRRRIADIISNDDLDVITRKAREEEAKRAKNIDALLGNFSTLSEEQLAVTVEEKTHTHGAPPTRDEGSDDAPIFVYKELVEKIKPHQINGARFLWSHITVEPDEVVKWLGKKDTRRLGLFTLESSREKKMTNQVYVVKKWHKRGGILVMAYELYRLLLLQSTGREKIGVSDKNHAHSIKLMYSCLSDPGPDLIVLDEGHRVLNHKSKMVKALAHVKTKCHIYLTG